MERFLRKFITLLLCFAMCIGFAAPAYAANDKGISFNATLSNSEITTSSEPQTVNLALTMSSSANVAAMDYTVSCDKDGITFGTATNPPGLPSWVPETGKMSWMDSTGSGYTGTDLGTIQINVPADVATGVYTFTVNITNLTDTNFNAWETSGEATATLTVKEKETPKQPYEIYYTLDSNATGDDAFKDYEVVDENGDPTKVDATIHMVSNNADVTLQAYDIYLTHDSKLKYSGISMDGADALTNAGAGASATAGLTHLQLVAKNKSITLTKGVATPLGTVTFTIDPGVECGYDMPITLTQGTTNISIAQGVTTAEAEAIGDTQSYYPTVIQTVDGVTYSGAEVMTTYEVTFDANADGETVNGMPDGNKKTKQYNVDMDMPVLTRTNYTFDGWQDESGNIYASGVKYTANAGAKLTAIWTPNTFTVTWRDADGNVIETDNGVTLNSTPSVDDANKAPEKTETAEYTYQFAGWGIGSGATEIVELAVYKVTGNVDFYPVYTKTPKSYTLTFANGYGGNISQTTVAYGSEVQVPADPSREGYTFAGWDQTISTMPAKDVTITAKWTPITYSITFDGNENDGGSTSNIAAAEYDTEYTLTNGFTKTGHTFVEWNTVKNPTTEMPGESYSGTEPVKNLATQQGAEVKLYAQWKANTYTVTFHPGTGGTGNTYMQDFTYGAAQSLKENEFAPTDTSYGFAGWALREGGAVQYKDTESITVTGNMDLYAVWAQNTIRYKPNPDNVDMTLTGLPSSYTIGQALPITAKPTATGYTFNGWSCEALGINTVGNPNASITIPDDATGNIELTAHWTVNQYTITFANGYDETPISSTKLDYGADVTTPENPTREGYTFAGWDKEVPKTMKAEDITITAQWTINKYTITFDGCEDAENVPADITQDYNTTVTKPTELPTKEGYTFAGWDVNGDGDYEEIEDKFPETMPHTNAENKIIPITAIWTEHTYSITYDRPAGVTYDSTVEDKTGVMYTDKVTLPDATLVTKPGYTLTGWTVTETGVEGSKIYTPDEEVSGLTANNNVTVILTPVWTPINYTIVFNANGGTGSMENIAAVYGEKYTLANAFTRNGYSFAGWATTADGAKVYENNAEVSNLTTIADSTFNLYAVWAPVTYHVTLVVPEDDTYNNTTVAYDIVNGGTLPTPSNGLFTFNGWKVTTAYGNWTLNDVFTGSIGANYYGSTNENENVVLTAVWGFEVVHDIEDYKYAYNTKDATGGYVMLRVKDNLAADKEYQFDGKSMYWTEDENYKFQKTDEEGVFFLLIGEEYFDSTKNALNAEGEKLLKVADATNRTTLLAEGENKWDINGDSAVNIADANIVYQMVQNGGAYYSYSDGQNGGQLDNKHRLMADLATARDDENNVHRASIMDVNEIVNKINGKTN